MNRRGFVKALGLVPVGVALSTIVTESPSNKVDPPKIKSMYEANARSQGWDGEEMNHHLDAASYYAGYDHTERMMHQEALNTHLREMIDQQAFEMMSGVII